MNASTTEPSVVCVLLTNGKRDALARRAVSNFNTQTYQQKRLCIVNSGPGTLMNDETHEISEPCFIGADTLTIGELRNIGNDAAEYRPFSTRKQPDILIHWDDDDYSHPNRIAEQVALLQSSGADVVGYNEMLFWRQMFSRDLIETTAFDGTPQYTAPYRSGEAWLYSDHNPTHILGTSLCYWRKTWERKPFESTSQGEDYRFISGLKVAASISIPRLASDRAAVNRFEPSMEPRMIARIHPGNTSAAYDPAKMKRAREWTRVPEWDSFCAGIMA